MKSVEEAIALNKHEIDSLYEFYGSYYLSNSIMYRNLLEIHSKDIETTDMYDALVIMLNPGGSKPKDESCLQEKSFTELLGNELVACTPDDTQYQIAKLMYSNNWGKVGVINLFDICEPESENIKFRYTVKYQENKNESIFCEDRKNELEARLINCKENAPLIIGWGVANWSYSRSYEALFTISNYEKILVGYKNKKDDYYHPSPREDDDDEFKMEWLRKVDAELKK